ncbi:hypothetical protein BWI92_02415 [Flectobacillus sp. BAB-3569]|nr:hypothetical protein BWI92_02415 [Flectobacillus sp. BAB-3569]
MGASTIVNSASIAQLMGWTKEYSAKKIREVKRQQVVHTSPLQIVPKLGKCQCRKTKLSSKYY